MQTFEMLVEATTSGSSDPREPLEGLMRKVILSARESDSSLGAGEDGACGTWEDV